MQANCYNCLHRSVWTQSKLIDIDNDTEIVVFMLSQMKILIIEGLAFISLKLSGGGLCMCICMYVSIQVLEIGFFHWTWISPFCLGWLLSELSGSCLLPVTLRPQASAAMSSFLWEYWGFKLRSLPLGQQMIGSTGSFPKPSLNLQ